MITISNRNIFIGGHVTPQVKESLTKRAFELGISLSKLLSDLCEKGLSNENANY